MPATLFSRLSRGAALSLLALVVAVTAGLVLAALAGHAPAAAGDVQGGDLALYQHIVERLHAGEPFYPAMHSELLSRGYPTASIFNWRTPLLLTLDALAPSILTTQIVLGLLAMIGAGLSLALFVREGQVVAMGVGIVAAILCYGLAMVPLAATFGEVVAGFLILVSAGCYGLRWGLAGMAIALLALFMRELAGPYVLICGAFALLEGRKNEVRLAVLGLAGYAVYYALHVHGVLGQLGQNEPSDGHSWLYFGGPAFVVRTAAMNGLFFLAPVWLSAIVLPVGLMGLFALRATWRMGVTVLVYALLFLAVGKPFDDYWGALYTPLLAPGLALALAALRDLLGALRLPAPLTSHAADGL